MVRVSHKQDVPLDWQVLTHAEDTQGNPRQAQLASHLQLRFQPSREGHALIACWNSFEDGKHAKGFGKKTARWRGSNWGNSFELMIRSVEFVAQGENGTLLYGRAPLKGLKSRQNAIPHGSVLLPAFIVSWKGEASYSKYQWAIFWETEDHEHNDSWKVWFVHIPCV